MTLLAILLAMSAGFVTGILVTFVQIAKCPQRWVDMLREEEARRGRIIR